jgi:aspartyl/asparaginyl-tRNA synthetase
MATRHTLVRDARQSYEFQPDLEPELELRGRLTKSWGRSNRVRFFKLQDFSEAIQVVVLRDELEPETFQAFTELTLGSGVALRGHVAKSSNGTISFFPTAGPRLLTALTDVELLHEDASGIATQVLLARLESLVRTAFLQQDYVELTPRYLSSSWPKGGLEPLQVRFAGQSVVPLYLAVSPVPQLVRSILAVGDKNFFTVSRTFATNFLADQNGAEAIVAACIELEAAFESVVDDSVDLIQHLLASPSTGTSSDIREHWASTPSRSEGPTIEIPSEPNGLHLHIASEAMNTRGPGNFLVGRAFQVHWRSQLILLDGYELQIAQDTYALVRVIYLERCLRLMQAQDNRRIRDMVNPHTPEDAPNDEDSEGETDAARSAI